MNKDNQNQTNEELNYFGFSTPKARRNLIYTAFSLLIAAIIILARQVNIERKNFEQAQRDKDELREDMYNRLYNDMQILLKGPKAQIHDAVTKVDSAAEKVKTIAEKIDNKN